MESKSLKWDAELYQDSSNLQFELGMMAMDMLKPIEYERILDLGCGNGLLTIELAKRARLGHVTGVEASPEMIRSAQRNAASLSTGNITLVNMDALAIEFDNEFDAVFSNSAIQWIHDLDSIYRLLFRSLKPGGRMMVQTSLKESNTLYEAINAILKVQKYQPYYRSVKWPWKFLTREENIELVSRAGSCITLHSEAWMNCLGILNPHPWSLS
jgi:ubiquinone/menaquinone biosynthesis C-methylase UbiE